MTALAESTVTSAEIAEQLGVHASTVGRWRAGDSVPSHEHADTLIALLGTPAGAATPPADALELLRAIVVEQADQLAALSARVGELGAEVARLRRATPRGAAGSQ